MLGSYTETGFPCTLFLLLGVSMDPETRFWGLYNPEIGDFWVPPGLEDVYAIYIDRFETSVESPQLPYGIQRTGAQGAQCLLKDHTGIDRLSCWCSVGGGF